MSEGENKKPQGTKKPNRNRRYKNNRPKAKTPTGNKTEGVSASASTDKPKNKKRRNNSNRKPKPMTPERVAQKYDNLMEQYVTARKKYFDLVGRSAQKQMGKVKKSYATALAALRKYETDLKDWQSEVLQKKVDGFPHDREYSKNNNIEPVGDIVAFTGDFEDPHLLPKQKAEEWSLDTEESSGTIEDYQKYKESMR